MNNYYLTFGQKHPLKNGYVLVQATTEDNARKVVFEIFGEHWANLYNESNMDHKYFPTGQYGKVVQGD